MTTISMPEFRRDSDAVILKVQQGEVVVLTDEGKPGIRLQPVAPEEPTKPAGSLMWMCELGEKWISATPESRESLTNEDIDRIVYGS